MIEGNRKVIVALGLAAMWLLICGVAMFTQQIDVQSVFDNSYKVIGIIIGLFVAGNGLEKIFRPRDKKKPEVKP